MSSDRKIGKIVSVDTYKAIIELDSDVQGFVKNSFVGTYKIGVINSYIIVPVGIDKIVGIVNSVSLNEDSEISYKGSATLVLPQSRRIMKVTLIGSIIPTKDEEQEKVKFEYGVASYPQLDNPVWSISEAELEIVFKSNDKKSNLAVIGNSTIFPEYSVKIDIDKFFGKHAAILGNTGSGKSCTVTAVIKSVLDDKPEMKNAHFIIFDTNNEYEKAFTTYNGDGSINQKLFDRLVIRGEGFQLPHWFMNWQDYDAIFSPAEQTQAPLLANSLRRARNSSSLSTNPAANILDAISATLSDIRSLLQPAQNRPIAQVIRELCVGFQDGTIETQVNPLVLSHIGFQVYKVAFTAIFNITPSGQWAILSAGVRSTILDELAKVEIQFGIDNMQNLTTNLVNVDTPKPFLFSDLVTRHIEDEIIALSNTNNRIRGDVGTMLLRINRLFNDERYGFLFKINPFEKSLSSFLRYILGESPMFTVSGTTRMQTPWDEYYLKSYPATTGESIIERHRVTIIDFSQVASDVLENTTALVGRLIFEFMQRVEPRGTFPIVLVLEEAHHYIPERIPEGNSRRRQERARQVFERIAKEGRKFGLSLLVASQRPSELSRTIIAQCNSFIVHRIQNPEDQSYFQSVVSSVNRDLLNQLPTLPQQSALIMGDCVTAPIQVNIRPISPTPNSNDPSFSKEWSRIDFKTPDFEKIGKDWENGVH